MTQVTGTVTATHLTYQTVEILVPNGDFESCEPSTSYIPDWDITFNNYATVTVATGALAYEGDFSVELYSQRPNSPAKIQQSYNTTATGISMYYNTDLGGIAQLVLGFDDGDTEVTTTVDAIVPEWSYIVLDISSVPNRATSGNVWVKTNIIEAGYCGATVDNIKAWVTTENVSSATIEDSSKTWTEDQFNTDGMFILKSGAVQGFSCTILDTFENYIQVPTTFANIINNIESGTTYYAATVQLTNGGFEEGDFTDWDYTPEDFDVNEEHKFATGGIQSATVHNGSYALWYEAWCDGYPDSTEFSLCTATFDITEITKITFWYNIPTLVSGGNVYLRVRVATDGDGETPVVVSEDYHSVTDGWVQGVLNVATLSGTAYLHFYGYVPLPEW